MAVGRLLVALLALHGAVVPARAGAGDARPGAQEKAAACGAQTHGPSLIMARTALSRTNAVPTPVYSSADEVDDPCVRLDGLGTGTFTTAVSITMDVKTISADMQCILNLEESLNLKVDTGQIWVHAATTAQSWTSTGGTSHYNDGSWHSVALTYDGQEVKLYADGALEATLGKTGNVLQSGGSWYGCRGGQERTDGSLRNLKIFGTALSGDQVSAVAQASAAQPAEYQPPALAPRRVANDTRCWNYADLRARGAWRFEQNGTGAGSLGQCAALVDQQGHLFGCTSGLFQFAEGPRGNCGCATDGCGSNSRASGEGRWDIYVLASEPPSGAPLPAGAPRIWETLAGPVFRVVEGDCTGEYRRITDVEECRHAGNALDVQPMAIEVLARVNAAFGTNFKQGEIEFNFPVFPGGCIVGPGGYSNGAAANPFTAKNCLWFNRDLEANQMSYAFAKKRVCVKVGTAFESFP